MARKTDKLKIPASVSGPLRKAGFEIGQTGGSVFLWSGRTNPESIGSVDDLIIAFGDNGLYGDPTEHGWVVQKTDDSGMGYLLLSGLRLDEAIEVARKLPEPNGQEIEVVAGAERSVEEALELITEMASVGKPNP